MNRFYRIYNNYVIIFVLTYIFVATNISGQYFVSSSSEISAIQSSLVPGDTVILKNGIWNNQIVKLTAQGTEEDTIVLRAETQGHVIFTGKSLFNIAGNYIKVDGLRFSGAKSSDDGIFEFRVGSSKAYNSNY